MAIFLYLEWHCRIKVRQRSSIVHHAFIICSCIFIRYNFKTLQVDNASWSCIHQWDKPHKKSEDNYKEIGFWDPNYRNISQHKNILAYSMHYLKGFAVSTLTSGTSWYYKQLIVSINKCSVSKKAHFICNNFIISKFYWLHVRASWWGYFNGVSSLSDSCLARNLDDLLDDVIGFFFFPYTWIRWFIKRCFQRVMWRWWVQGLRRNYISILCHTDTFIFPNCIIITKCLFQFFLSLVYHFHHIISLWILIFVRVKSTSQDMIGFFHIILCWRLIQTKNMMMQFITLIFLRV